jgi:hypothetical protein
MSWLEIAKLNRSKNSTAVNNVNLAFKSNSSSKPTGYRVSSNMPTQAGQQITALKGKQQTIAKFITRANYGMSLGNFELDFNDGEIRYKTSIDVTDDRLNFALIQ